MANKNKEPRGLSGGSEQVTPTRYPETTPVYPSSEFNFTLQAVYDIQKSVGKLTQAVETLTDQQARQGEKLDKISHKIYAAIAVLLVVGGILSFFAKGINDLLVHRIEANPPAAEQQTPLKK